MNCIRIEADGETRWVNLSQIARATLARPGSGPQLLVLFFASAASECTLKIEGNSQKNLAAIQAIVAALDKAAVQSP